MPLSPITPIRQPCFLSITVDITFVGLLLGPFVWLVLVAQAIAQWSSSWKVASVVFTVLPVPVKDGDQLIIS